MSKYQPLSDRLRGHPGDEWQASFYDLEQVLGFQLPKSARTGAWWSNSEEKPHSRAWAAHGWQAHEVDTGQGLVTFRRSDISPAAVEAVLEPVGDLTGVAPPESVPAASPPAAELSSTPAPRAKRPRAKAQPAVDEPAAPKPEKGAGGRRVELTTQAPSSIEVQPAAMKEAAEEASKKMHANRIVGMAAILGGAAAVFAGVGVVAARVLGRRRA